MYNLFDENLIKITRGNSISLQIYLTDTKTGDPFILGAGDSVLFTVSRNGEKAIQKMLTAEDYDPDYEGVLLCNIVPSETVNLLTGEYHYDCLLLTSDGNANTFISSALIVDEAVGVYTDIHTSDNSEEADDGGDDNEP